MPRRNRRSRNKNTQDRNSGGNWLQTYGDMITLLLAFFVLLYSISTVDAEKFERMLTSVHESFSGVLPEREAQIPTEDPVDFDMTEPEMEDIPSEEEIMMEETYRELANFIEEEGLEEVLVLEMDDRGLILRFQDKILFDPGRAQLMPEAKNILNEISQMLKKVPNEIKIEGFTDDVPQNTPRFPSNWELSTGRATSVLRYMSEENELSPYRLSATGYGEYRPMVPNTSDENRELNRRVDIVLVWSTNEEGELHQRQDVDLFERGENDLGQ